uniref:Globin family profile domain-containing protein n=1 Tax=Acrobeloides nanus TaxID=290746 RepID=A0A914DLG2_9BILA
MAKINIDADGVYNDLYEYMFTNFPELRVYFKGAENFTAADVHTSERFRKQGEHILLAIRILVNVFDDEITLKSYARETVNRHREFKLDPLLWKAFFTVFVGYLGTKIKLDEKTKKAWTSIGKVFAEECWRYLKESDFSIS